MEAPATLLQPFNIDRPELWDSWVEGFRAYLAFREITEPTMQRALLISACGTETVDLARALLQPKTLTDTSVDDIISALEKYFQPQPTKLTRHWDFRQRTQKAGESAMTFLTGLRRMACRCSFADLNEALLDQFVWGLRDDKLARKLLSLSDCDLTKAIDVATSWEKGRTAEPRPTRQAATHQVSPEPFTEDSDEDRALQTGHRSVGRKTAYCPPGTKLEPPPACASCGAQHERKTCRFRNATCRRCNKAGHIACACRSNTRARVPQRSTHSEDQQSCEIDSLNARRHPVQYLPPRARPSKIQAQVRIGGVPCQMEVDSGSASSIIAAETFFKIPTRLRPRLRDPGFTLVDFQRNKVPILGVGLVPVQYKGFKGQLQVLVVQNRLTNLLGLDWFKPLGLEIRGVNKTTVVDFNKVCEEFPAVFNDALGCYTGPPVSLHLDPTVRPVRLKARRVPFALKPKIEEELDKLIAQGVLEPVAHANWETPIVTPVKPSGEVRICADYKCTLNKALQAHAYPVPIVSHVLATLAGAKIFGKLDLAQAYQQLPVDEATANAQTIVTHRGAFRVKRLQFGVSVAPGLFQELMDSLLKGLPGVTPFFDDVLIAAASPEEFAARLRGVLQRFATAGLKVKREKCLLGVERVEFLGFAIDAQGVHPSDAKLRAIRDAPAPTNKQELQAFLGLLNFYHAFLPHKAAVAEPLHRLLDKNRPWVWSRQHAKAFQDIKGLLVSNSVLAHFDETLPLILACDASPYGVGAVLGHRLPDGTEVPIAYYSRTLSSAERNYAQIDKEGLAIVAGVKKFHDYIYGRPFTLYTDHKPLLGLFASDRQTPQVLSPRVLRWSIFLAGYTYTLEHRPGKAMGHADALSRLPLPDVDPDPAPAYQILLTDTLPDRPLLARDVAARSARDPVLSRVLDWVGRGWPKGPTGPKFTPFATRKDELSTHKGCLLWGNRVVIPKPLQDHVLKALHEAHPGIVRMKALARSYVWWPGLDAEIEDWVKRCTTCQVSRPDPPQSPVYSWESTKNPWARLHMDFAGPFQGRTLLIIVDSYSKWLEVVQVPSPSSQATIRALRPIFATHGLPETIVTDNGTAFTSAEFQDYLAGNLIRHIRSAPFHPATNGQAERMVRTAKEALKRLGPTDWPKDLACFLMAYRTTPTTSTGRSPAELLMGRRISTLLDKLHPDRAPDRRPAPEYLEAPRGFYPGEPVWVRNYAATGPAWLPGKVDHVTGPVSYVVTVEDGRLLKRHIDQLRGRLPTREPESEPPDPDHASPREPDTGQGPMEPASAQQEGTPDHAAEPRPSGPAIPAVSSSAAAEPPTESERPVPPELRRSTRDRQPPAYLKDYVTG